MSDYDRDRGAYSPTGEAPLAFDARHPSQRGAGRPPTTLIISALILLVLVVALIFYYRSGVRRSGEPPVVGAPLSDMTAAAPASAQPDQETTGMQVYGAEQAPAAAGAPTFAPGPEEPLPREAAPAPVHTPAPVAAAPAASAPAPATPAAPPPAPKPAPASTPAPAASGGGASVQIGALSSPALADKAWNDVARKMPGDMVGRTKRVEPITTDTGTLYRAYIGGFSSKSEATEFCDTLKAAGTKCIVR